MESKTDSPALKGLLAIGWSRHKEHNYSLSLYNSTRHLCIYKEQGNTIPRPGLSHHCLGLSTQTLLAFWHW